MKKIYVLLFANLMLFSISSVAQSVATSPKYSFKITKEVKPPIWEIIDEPHFVDENNNNAIDAKENCKIVMKVKNIGYGDGVGLTAKISGSGTVNGLTFADKKIANIPVDGIATIEYPISANMKTADGSVVFSVYINEPNGFITEKYHLQIQTRKFQEPLIKVKEFAVSSEKGGKLEKMKPFDLQILVQNVKQGVGEDISIELDIPTNVMSMSGQLEYKIAKLEAGDYKTFTFPLIVNGLYDKNVIPLKVIIKEKYGLYSQNEEIRLNLDESLAVNTIVVDATHDTHKEIADVSLRSDVDRNIPKTNVSSPHTYAIIIGNEDYHSQQTSLNDEQDVPFASTDATIFKQYCVNTLGISANNIVLLTNATAAKMKQEIDFITRLAARDPDAEILFFYAGHGYPDETTKVPYLIPVDVNASNIKSGIALSELYETLASANAKKVVVFLDACFSGGGRNAGLVASRGIRVAPKKDALSGNIVVFSATSADQTALPYADKNHGMFTYFLLKKMQESEGYCTLGDIETYLKTQVGDNSLRINRKEQNPEVSTSLQVSDTWKGWRIGN